MSLVSVLPYGRTLDYWWEKLAGHPDRRRFMAIKALEVSAFVPNGRHNARLSRGARPIDLPPRREPLPWPAQASIAVVVPMHARTEADLDMAERLVARLQDQTYADYSVTVVDDSSPRRLELDVEVIRLDQNRGPAHARNVGVEQVLQRSPGAIAFTDMDCVPDRDWLSGVAAGFATRPSDHILSGRTDAADRSWLGRYHELNGTLNGRRMEEGLLYGPTCNLAVRAAVFDDLRFDPSFPTAAAEDIDFCLRALARGWSIAHCPDMHVCHDFGYDTLSRPDRLRRLWGQFRRYAQGERRLLRAHPGYAALFEVTMEIAAELAASPSPGHAGTSEPHPVGFATQP